MKQFLRLLLSYPLCLVVAIVMTVTSCSESHKDGKLPKDYSWAYGVWQIRESFEGKEDEHPCNLLIGDSYIQSDGVYLSPFFVEGDLIYPIYTLPKQEYDLYPGDTGDPDDPDEICLSYATVGDYESRLYLNKKSRTVSSWSAADRKRLGIKCSSKRRRIKEDPDLIRQYNALLQDSPANGTWRNVRNRRDKRIITASDGNYVLTRNGLLIEHSTGSVIEYLPDSDRIKVGYSNTEDWVTDIYARFDSKQELKEKLASCVAGKTFSCSKGSLLSPSIRNEYVYYFKDNGSGTWKFYDVSAFGSSLRYSGTIKWWIDDEERLVVKTNEGDTDYFTIGSGYIDNHGDIFRREY